MKNDGDVKELIMNVMLKIGIDFSIISDEGLFLSFH